MSKIWSPCPVFLLYRNSNSWLGPSVPTLHIRIIGAPHELTARTVRTASYVHLPWSNGSTRYSATHKVGQQNFRLSTLRLLTFFLTSPNAIVIVQELKDSHYYSNVYWDCVLTLVAGETTLVLPQKQKEKKLWQANTCVSQQGYIFLDNNCWLLTVFHNYLKNKCSSLSWQWLGESCIKYFFYL